MAVARHGGGPTAAGRAFASQVHPVFMLPPVATAAFGAILAPTVHAPSAVAHLIAVFFAVYTAHVKDGYIDFHHRGEDADHPLTIVGCRLALVLAGAGFLGALVSLWMLHGLLAVTIVAPMWLIGYFHAPQLDTTTVGATCGYPVGVAVAFLGGYIIQTHGLSVQPIAIAVVLVILLVGVKIIDDSTDYQYDHRAGKPTVAVILGRRQARQFANMCLLAAILAVGVFVVVGILPPSSIAAGLVFGIIGGIAGPAEPELATMLLVRGAYLFLALLIAAIWFHPLS